MTHHTHVQGQKPGRTSVLWAVLTAALAASILTTNVVPIPLLSGPTAAIALGCAVLLVRAHRRRKHAASPTTRYTASEH
jgi:choline-glycine betaine transporter